MHREIARLWLLALLLFVPGTLGQWRHWSRCGSLPETHAPALYGYEVGQVGRVPRSLGISRQGQDTRGVACAIRPRALCARLRPHPHAGLTSHRLCTLFFAGGRRGTTRPQGLPARCGDRAPARAGVCQRCSPRGVTSRLACNARAGQQALDCQRARPGASAPNASRHPPSHAVNPTNPPARRPRLRHALLRKPDRVQRRVLGEHG